MKYDESGVNTLRAVLAGAFYRKYMRADYKNEHERLKLLKGNIISPAVAFRSVIYNKVPDFIKELHIKMVISNIIDLKAEKVEIMYEKPIVTLEDPKNDLLLLNNLKK